MVKVQKPSTKSIKKDVLKKTKKTQIKRTGANSAPEDIQNTKKKVETAAKEKIVVKRVKPKSSDLIKKSKSLEGKIKNITKKTLIVDGVQENVKKDVQKKKKVVPGVKEKVNKIIEGKNRLASKVMNKKEKLYGKTKKNQKKEQSQNLKVRTKKIAPKILVPVNFDEQKFKEKVCLRNIKKICKALKELVEKEVSEKKTSIFSDYKYLLNVSSYKIPNCPKRMVKLNLKHSLVDIERDDVVMIVPDLQRGAKVDYNPTIEHYEDLLREIDMSKIKIVPFNQLRNECTSFEAKRKFSNTYDYFLCDGRIVGHVVGFCGKHFQKSRTTIHAVRLDNPKTYKRDIEHALRRTSYRQLHRGNMVSIPVGNHLFTIIQLAENIEDVIDQLKTIFPGSYANIRNIQIKIDIKGTSSLPLYINLAGAPAEVPNVIGPREQKLIKLKKETNTILSKFSMTKAGDFVKLNKAQVKKKQQIQKSRKALLSKEKIKTDENDGEFQPPLNKKAKKDVSKSNTDDKENEDCSDSNNQEEDGSDNTEQEEDISDED